MVFGSCTILTYCIVVIRNSPEYFCGSNSGAVLRVVSSPSIKLLWMLDLGNANRKIILKTLTLRSI